MFSPVGLNIYNKPSDSYNDFEENYNYGNKTVEIIQEQSPNNICSREGVSSGWPLICLPNRIRVEFDTNPEDFTV